VLHACAAVQGWTEAVCRAGTTEGAKVADELRAGSFNTTIDRIRFDTKDDLVGSSTLIWYA
jgi:branched-chain amino acid transport system substrate-binding protein